jgi:acetyl esterase
MARDRGGPRIIFQLLEIPALDCTMSQPSIEEYGVGLLLTRADMDQAVAYYLSDPAQAREPTASPLLAPDLTGLPPARILTCEFDPLRDEGEEYGRRLAAAGVPVTVSRYAGHVHSSTYATRILPSARRYVAEACAALRAAYTE